MDLTDEQWAVVEPLIGEMPRRADGRGRPWRSSREVLNGILGFCARAPNGPTCPSGIRRTRPATAGSSAGCVRAPFERMLEALARDLKERGNLDLSECFIDGTFVVAKKGADVWERPSGAKVRSSWQWQTALVFLSPFVPPRLRLTRSPSSPPPSTPAS